MTGRGPGLGAAAGVPQDRCRRAFRARLSAALLPLLLATAVLIAGCGEKADETQSTPSPVLEPTATAEAASDISTVDFSQVPAVESLLEDSGGQLLPQETIFADLTGDGVDEAVVPISSGGTGGDIAYAVFADHGGDLKELLQVKPEAGRVTAAVQDGVLVDTQPVYAPEDPLCCPSQLKHTFYRWDGEELIVDREETETVPSAKP